MMLEKNKHQSFIEALIYKIGKRSVFSLIIFVGISVTGEALEIS